MEKPKKKEIDTYVEFGCEPPHDPYAKEKGYNQACEEYDQWILGELDEMDECFASILYPKKVNVRINELRQKIKEEDET